MSLAAPWFLLALALLPLGVVAQRAAQRRRRRFAVRFPGVETVVAAMSAGGSRWRRRLPGLLLAAAVAVLAVALARPQATVAVASEQASVILVTDTSGSMGATDIAPTRLEAARAAAERFLEKVPERLAVGLIAYSSAPHTVHPPSTDRESVQAALLSLGSEGATATGDALDVAIERIEEEVGEEGRRPPSAIVLLSDGKATRGVDPVEVAGRAGSLKIPIYTVALGTDEGTVPAGFGVSIRVPPDRETLREVARASGGRAFEVEDAEELDQVYEGLGSRVGRRDRKREVTAAFAAVGLLLLGGAAGTSLRWRGRVG